MSKNEKANYYWELLNLDPKTIQLPIEYQRDSHIIEKKSTTERQKKMAKDWNPLKCKLIIVAQRKNGKYYAVDGFNRVKAAIEAGVKTVPCGVIKNLSLSEEATIYESQRESKTLRPLNLFKAGLISGKQSCITTEKVLKQFNLQIGSDAEKSPNSIACVGTLRLIVDRYGEKALVKTLTIARDTWGGFIIPESKNGQLLLTIAIFYVNHNLTDPTLLAYQRKWTKVSPLRILQLGRRNAMKEGCNIRQGIFQALESIKRRKNNEGQIYQVEEI